MQLDDILCTSLNGMLCLVPYTRSTSTLACTIGSTAAGTQHLTSKGLNAQCAVRAA